VILSGKDVLMRSCGCAPGPESIPGSAVAISEGEVLRSKERVHVCARSAAVSTRIMREYPACICVARDAEA